MYKLLPFLGFLIFFSCTQDCKQDCSECENKLDIWSREVTPVDLPESEPDYLDAEGSFLTIRVTRQDEFEIDGEKYSIQELYSKVELKLDTTSISNRKLRIEGDKMAHYEAIFQVLELAQKQDLNPVLKYNK